MVIFHRIRQERRYPHGDIIPSLKLPIRSYSYFTPQPSSGWVHDSDSVERLRYPITQIPYRDQEQEEQEFAHFGSCLFPYFFGQEIVFEPIFCHPFWLLWPVVEKEKDDYADLVARQADGRRQRRDKIEVMRHQQAQYRKCSKRDGKISLNAQKRTKIYTPANHFTRIRSKR